MTLLTANQIEQLATPAEAPRVSLYLPTHRTSPGWEQDRIRLKNLLAAAARDLEGQGVRATIARDLLAPARRLLEDVGFWTHLGDGLAVFLAPEQMQVYRLPIAVPELQVAGNRFHVKPLFGLLGRDGRYFVLAISQQAVRLLEASRDSVRELDLHDVPETLRDVVGYDFEQRSLQFHTGAGIGKGGRRAAVFHGHGAPRDDEQAEIATFLRRVDEGVAALLPREGAPLVLAGVDRIVSAYRSVTRLPDVLERAVGGNPDQLSADALAALAWQLVEPRFVAEQLEAVERYGALAGTGRTSNELGTVVRAAADGRVETLFVAAGTQRWGRFDPASREADVGGERRPGDEDLLDVAAVQTLRTGGAVYVVEPDRVPGGELVAAVLRH